VPGEERCDVDIFTLGATPIAVVTKCGEPDWKKKRYETVTQITDHGRRQISAIIDE